MKLRAYKDRLKGHKDVILEIKSPYGPETGVLYSISKDGFNFKNRNIKNLGFI